MLILTRRVGEVVMIGNDVTVTVLGVKGNQVRIGVNAPRDVAVHREEIFERIKREEQDGESVAPRAGRATVGDPTPDSLGPARPGSPRIDGEKPPDRAPTLRRSAGRLSSAALCRPERWPSGRRRAPAKGVRVKSPSRVRIPLSPPVQFATTNTRP